MVRTTGHKFNPAHADRLLQEERRQWNNPEQILAHLDLAHHRVMADIGCGPGWFALPAARQLAPNGKVYGIDTVPEMLARLKENAEAVGLTNVVAVQAEEDAEYPVPTGVADAALLANLYHEVDSASMFLSELRRILAPGAVCLVVDWRKEPMEQGPPVDHRVAEADAIAEFSAAGFTLLGNVDVGPYHYGLKFRRNDS